MHESNIRNACALVNSKALFIEAVRAKASLPASLRERAGDVTALEEHRFDESYIEFLDTQIGLSPRGREWIARLSRRRAALLPFCGVPLLRGRVQVGDADFTVEIDPKTGAVIHWEEWHLAHRHPLGFAGWGGSAIVVGVPVFMVAWWLSASVRGYLVARFDVARGHYEMQSFGLHAKGRPDYARLLRERYAIELHTVGGCVVSDSLGSYVPAYNSVSKAAAERKFGRDVFAECMADADMYSYLSSSSTPAVLPAAKADSLREGMTVEQLRSALGRGYLSPHSGGGLIEWFFADGRALVLSPTVGWSPSAATTFKRQSGTIALQWMHRQPPQIITIPSK